MARCTRVVRWNSTAGRWRELGTRSLLDAMTGDYVRRTHGCATVHVGKSPRSVTTARSPYEPSGVVLGARSCCLPRTCLSMLISGSRGTPNTLTCDRARVRGPRLLDSHACRDALVTRDLRS